MRKILGFIALALVALIAVFFLWPEKAYKPYEVSEAYRVQAEGFNLPSMPPDWHWAKFETADGTKLRWGETGNRNTADVTLLIIPGYTASVSMYGEHVDLLAERGFHVMGIDLRGQGGSDRHFANQPEKLWVEDFSIYSNDLKSFIEAQNFPETQIIIPMAISFGGHVALRTAGEFEGLFDGLVLLAPAIEPKAGEMSFDKALSMMNLMRKLGKANRYLPGGGNWEPVGDDYTVAGIELCSSNAKRLYLRDSLFTRYPEQRVGGVTAQWGAEFFESSLYVREPGFMEKINIPIFIASAELDNFVSTEVNHAVCESRLSSCYYIQYPSTGHCLPQEFDETLNAIFDEILTLADQIKASRD